MRRKHRKYKEVKLETKKQSVLLRLTPLPSRQKVSPADIDVIVSGIFENDRKIRKHKKERKKIGTLWPTFLFVLSICGICSTVSRNFYLKASVSTL